MNDAERQIENVVDHLKSGLDEVLMEFLPRIPQEHKETVSQLLDLYAETIASNMPALMEAKRREAEEWLAGMEKRLIALEQSFQAETRRRLRINGRGRKPGKRKLPVNDWAREQYAVGKTIDELLPEYAEKRKMRDLVQARELLRKAVK